MNSEPQLVEVDDFEFSVEFCDECSRKCKKAVVSNGQFESCEACSAKCDAALIGANLKLAFTTGLAAGIAIANGSFGAEDFMGFQKNHQPYEKLIAEFGDWKKLLCYCGGGSVFDEEKEAA